MGQREQEVTTRAVNGYDEAIIWYNVGMAENGFSAVDKLEAFVMDDENQQRSMKLPARVVVTLRAGGILAAANIVCAIIIAMAYVHVRQPAKTLSVTGQATKNIQSNLIIWTAQVTGSNANREKAFAILQSGMKTTLAYLAARHIPLHNIQVSSISSTANYKRDKQGHLTHTISGWDLRQSVTVTSHQVLHVARVGRQITDLINQGVQIDSRSPKYIYTKLASLKLVMLAAATRDAKDRATQIANNGGARISRLLDASMGVMQIDPAYSTNVSWQGNDDTTSYKKVVIAVIHADFLLK